MAKQRLTDLAKGRRRAQREERRSDAMAPMVSQRMFFGVILCLFIVIGVARILLTYPSFSHTWDAPQHIGNGLRWFSNSPYPLATEAAPLPELLVALGPYLSGHRDSGKSEIMSVGLDSLYANGRYEHNLMLAKLPVILSFVIACLATYAIAHLLFGPVIALLSAIMFSFLPIILGHSAVATTDMCFTAAFLLAIFAWLRWLDKPTRKRALLFFALAAVSFSAKYSTVLHLPASCLLIWLVHLYAHPGGRFNFAQIAHALPTVILGGLIFLLVAWASYGFSIRPLAGETPYRRYHSMPSHPVFTYLTTHFGKVQLPLIEPFHHLHNIWKVNRRGQINLFLGKKGLHGWWSFYPVGVWARSPLAFFFMVLIGIISVWIVFVRTWDWRLWVPLAGLVAIFSVGFGSHVNIGVRRVLIVFPFLAMLAAFGVHFLWQRSWGKVVACALGATFALSSLLAHPDYLTYFNEWTQSDRVGYLLESDVDWGQDLKRLSQELKIHKVPFVHIAYHGIARLWHHELPKYRKLPPGKKVKGWVAISLRNLKLDTSYAWLNAYTPKVRVGHSIVLYYIP